MNNNSSFPPFSSLRLLHLDDNPTDAELIRQRVSAEWPDATFVHVQNGPRFTQALEDKGHFDLIVSDFSLPGFTGMDALRLAQQYRPDTPFIFVSGTIGEDNAIEALRQGATDYVSKDRIFRLVPTIRRAMAEKQQLELQRQAEQHLRESQQQFQVLTGESQEIFWWTDFDLENNPSLSIAIERIWGRPAAEFYRDVDVWLDTVIPVDRRRVRQAFGKCVAGKTTRFDAEYRITAPDGTLQWRADSATVIRNPEGVAVRLSGVARDITQQKATHQRLRQQAELLDQARDAIVVTDMDYRIVYWNRGAEKVFGWTAEEANGRRATELFGADAVQVAMTADGADGEFTLSDKGGQPHVLKFSVTLIHDDDGRSRSQLLIITDITAQKEMELQLLRTQRLESLGLLAAGIAHDLNNVLTPVLIGTPLLRPHLTDATDNIVLNNIESSAVRGVALVRQILSFARGATGEKNLIQLDHLLREIGDLVRQTFPKSIHFASDIPENLWAVRGNLTQLHQVLLNLCVNARDAMAAGGTLSVRAANKSLDEAAAAKLPDAKPGSYTVLEVADTGAGIPPEVLAQIWNPFFTTKEAGRGTGLGLATVRGIAANHDGFATVDTELGKGSIFRVYLPAISGDVVAEPSTTETSAHSAGQGELILVVDDDDGVRTLVETILTHHGYRVLVAGNGQEALALFASRAREFALIITDIDMPEMDGIALGHALFNYNPSAKIVFMTGTETIAARSEFPDSSVKLIHKPFRGADLLFLVRQLVVPLSAVPPAPKAAPHLAVSESQ